MQRKAGRDIELEDSNGWVSTHKVHKNKKNIIPRKSKHKK